MERKKFAEFIRALKEANKRGEDVDVIMKAHEHENAYIYNDGVFKKIFASEENVALTTDLVNASLDLFGSDCISHPRIVNPFVPGKTGNGSVEPDVMLVNDRGGGMPRDRISIDVQHNGYTLYPARLVLYVSRITSNMVKRGDPPLLENLNVVSFQFFDAFPKSKNYRHTVQLRNQEDLLYFDMQTMTIVEVKKFLDHAEAYAGDNSRLAQWLRAIDTLNRDADFSGFSQDPVFRVLQNAVKMYNFSARYLMTVDMSDVDRAMAVFDKQEQIAKNMLLDGDSVEKIARNTGVPLFMVNKIKERLAQEET